ncbi:probable methyltransferase PMT27 [Actinidia eriantha]|uniref:probable methyltransferase PMT27 n=1 Tax=Actinidia eriantha TaxID=165200 RepID=UPI002584EDB0|nr:probable methyltransferase PMT27 [Actinidia eriantha]
MAFAKARNSKRSSGTSYTSTATTIVFIAFCVMGVWMLTTNSAIYTPQSTSRTATTNDATTDASINTNDYSSSAKNSHPTELTNKKNEVFEDNPGQLPEDAIKSDDPSQSKQNNDNDNSQAEQENRDVNGNSQGSEQDSENETKNDEENVIKKPGSAEEVNPQSLQGKESVEEEEKQKQRETQVSEESSMTQNQQVEETATDLQTSTQKISGGEDTQKSIEDQESKGKEHVHGSTDVEKTRRKVDHQESPQDEVPHKDQQINEEEQQKGQQKEQSQQEIGEGTSHDQIEHDEAVPLQSSTKNDDQRSQNNPNQRESNSNVDTKQKEDKGSQSKADDSFLGGESSGIPKESKESKKSWSTQADQSDNQKERRKNGSEDQDGGIYGYTWQLCNVTAGTDYIPCLDNEKALRKLHTTRHFEHRERHCPEEAPTCLVPLPEGYKRPIDWPKSRDKIWYHNVPHTKLAEVKGHQNWVKVTGEFLTFPGGGTQFIHGALHYIDFIQEAVPDIAWGKHTRVVLDVGCGVASFGGYLFDRDVLTMSFAPKDEHEAQVQFALERGIPAISSVMGSQRLPFPSRVFDILHCARCRVPWHAEGGRLLLELNRVLRPGGYFVWSATPVYQTLEEDVQIWKEMSALTKSMCWELVTIKKDKLNSVGAAIYHKAVSNECYDQRKQNRPPMCKSDDDPNAAWYVALQSCMHRVPVDKAERGSRWPDNWPRRVQTPPYWLNKSQMGIYGKPAPVDFTTDFEHWKRVVSKTYLSGLGISWNNVRNIMDMRAVYGGFAAALKDLKVWVLNVVNVDSPDTLPIIFERGLFGIYHDWCESFSTYPRTYDLLHADHLFSRLKKRCKIEPVMAEIDRIVRPGGKLIVRDESSTISEVENLLKSLHWEVHLTFSKNQEGILSAQKSEWRPDSYANSS